MFIIPTRKRNCSGDLSSVEFESSEEITAACPEPKPGRKEAMGAISAAERIDFIIWIFVREILEERDCSGREIVDFKEINKVERPKRPVSKGKRGERIGR